MIDETLKELKKLMNSIDQEYKFKDSMTLEEKDEWENNYAKEVKKILDNYIKKNH